jgi:hypothetical protein
LVQPLRAQLGTLQYDGDRAANNPSQFPSLVSLNPFQGTGPNATLTLVYSDTNGWAAIKSAEFIVNPRWEPASRAGGCYVKYAPGTGLFTLIADDGNSIAGTAMAGSATSIYNSQCTLNAANSSMTGSGNTLTVVAALTFHPSFTGQRHIWIQVVDYHNVSTNWLVYGVWLPTQTTVNASPWYRIYDPFSSSYLYTFDLNEYNTLGAQGFVLQGISGLVMDGSTTVGGHLQHGLVPGVCERDQQPFLDLGPQRVSDADPVPAELCGGGGGGLRDAVYQCAGPGVAAGDQHDTVLPGGLPGGEQALLDTGCR